ncbi:MAG TPA: restriction endonuclease [bacterium]|jgi:restriction system protein
MTVPAYQELMKPILEIARDRDEHSTHEVTEQLADKFSLSDVDRNDLLPSGTQRTFDNRVSWAITYLKKAGLLESKKRAHFNITSDGLEVIRKNPDSIDSPFLTQFPSFVEFRTRRPSKTKKTESNNITFEFSSPVELMEDAYVNLRDELKEELIDQVKACDPFAFEKLVVMLLVRMGYGGSIKDAGAAIGRSGDEGIDGIIKEDKLGLDIIYIQAKKWENKVSRPEVQKFAGALQGKRAKKGVYITTSEFTQEAVDFAANLENKMILIDGDQLAEFMIDHNLGVTTVSQYDIKRLDSDFFAE